MKQHEECIPTFGRKPLGKCPLGGPEKIWEDNIKVDHQQIVCDNGSS
jgi:hypothetical protein